MYAVLLITCPNVKNAKFIAKILLMKKLAACISLIPGITSIYWWEGKIEESREVLLLIKTKSKLFEKIEHEIKKNHPYETPEIISLKITKGLKKYLDWMEDVIK